jgi:adenylosuccinate lyase
LLALVDQGVDRDEAYRLVQTASQRAWDERRHLREALATDPGLLDGHEVDLDAVFDYGHYTRHVPEIMARLDQLA